MYSQTTQEGPQDASLAGNTASNRNGNIKTQHWCVKRGLALLLQSNQKIQGRTIHEDTTHTPCAYSDGFFFCADFPLPAFPKGTINRKSSNPILPSLGRRREYRQKIGETERRILSSCNEKSPRSLLRMQTRPNKCFKNIYLVVFVIQLLHR